MLRNIKHYLASEEGIGIFDIVPLVIFFIIFIGIIIFVMKMPSKTIDEIKQYPLNDKNELDYGKKE